jgi:hypothetical protein
VKPFIRSTRAVGMRLVNRCHRGATYARIAAQPFMEKRMLKQWLTAILLCGVAGQVLAATVALRGTAGNASAALSWTVANGTINAQEVYRDTDADPNGVRASPRWPPGSAAIPTPASIPDERTGIGSTYGRARTTPRSIPIPWPSRRTAAPSLVADNWRDEGLVIRTATASNFNAIDPDLVLDGHGNPWLSLGSFNSGIKLTRLGSNMKPTGTLYSLANRNGGIEAPTIVLHNGYYYLFVSVGLCSRGVDITYQTRYGRSASITGPYLDKAGVDMMQGGGTLLDAGNQRWIGPGGQDIHGSSVIARHAYDATDNGAPKLLINTLDWDAQGWPKY